MNGRFENNVDVANKPLDLWVFLGFYFEHGGLHGVNIPYFIRVYFGVCRGDPCYKAIEARVRRSLDKFVKEGYLEVDKVDGLVWFRPSSRPPSHVRPEAKYSNRRAWRTEAIHVEHIRGQLKAYESYLSGLEFIGIKVWNPLSPQGFMFKVDGENRVKYALAGVLKLGYRKFPVLIRVYGFNRTVTRGDVKRDKALYKWFYAKYGPSLFIVISASYFERDAYFSLKRILAPLGLYRIIVEGYNSQLPYIGLKRRLAIEQKYRERYKRGHEVNPARPKNPPKIISLEAYETRLKMGYSRASRWIRSIAYERLLRGDPNLRELYIRYREEMDRWMICIAKGLTLAAGATADRINKLTKEARVYLGLDTGPPSLSHSSS